MSNNIKRRISFILNFLDKYFFEQIYFLFLGIFNSIYNFYLSIGNFFILITNFKLFRINNFINFYYKTNYSRYKNIKEKENIDKDQMELVYGETPFISLKKVLEEISLKKNSVFYDLGCGRGKVAFFVNLAYKIKTIGIDLMPTYINVAKSIVKRYKLENIEFFLDDILEYDFTDADVIYICGTCFQEATRKKLYEKLENINKELYVITATHALKSEKFEIVKKMKVLYSWGIGTLYINKNKKLGGISFGYKMRESYVTKIND
jgi:SAM-dependent methyltransferase